ncbi:MAG: DUF1446 domain-containing protein [Acidimicrobiia bacterium]|nr:DUF1446 domain-containing protein [Acidimicrobiia bacterium]
MTEPIRIANCSGFFGDRITAAREMVEGGPIDVLTGDWLAELTMLILARQRMKRPEAGWARTFLTQMEDVLARCMDDGIKVVTNAGGLNPAGLATAVHELAARLDVPCSVAHVEGDDIHPRLDEIRATGCSLENLDTGEKLEDAGAHPITANAYLGGRGIATALAAGADVVICGRVTDAALVVGPAAWHHGWNWDDWDALAGAVVAGHVIECGPQATGGNYAFFEEVPGLEHPGFPIAEVAADGSSVITKHPGTGGLVSVGTVTAQLLYEISSPEYHNPDVTARFDTIHLAPSGPDRVRVSGVRGMPPPPTLKVAMNYLGGFRNSMTFVLTGLDTPAKAELAERTLWQAIPGGRDAFDEVDVAFVDSGRTDPPTNDLAVSTLRITVKDRDESKVGRAFSDAVIQMALASYPGFSTTSVPQAAQPFGVYWPAVIPRSLVAETVVIGEQRIALPPAETGDAELPPPPPAEPVRAEVGDGDTVPVPLGRVAGARSGDKGGNANLGVWARDDAAFAWLDAFLTTERLRALLPEARALEIERHALPNLRALNFVLHGLLGRGVAASTRADPQAKGLGEYLRAKTVPVPSTLIPREQGTGDAVHT